MGVRSRAAAACGRGDPAWHPSRGSDAGHARRVQERHPELRVIPRIAQPENVEACSKPAPKEPSSRSQARLRCGSSAAASARTRDRPRADGQRRSTSAAPSRTWWCSAEAEVFAHDAVPTGRSCASGPAAAARALVHGHRRKWSTCLHDESGRDGLPKTGFLRVGTRRPSNAISSPAAVKSPNQGRLHPASERGLGRPGCGVLLDQRAAELRLPMHELNAITFERTAACADCSQLLPFADEFTDSLSQALDVRLVSALSEAHHHYRVAPDACRSHVER